MESLIDCRVTVGGNEAKNCNNLDGSYLIIRIKYIDIILS